MFLMETSLSELSSHFFLVLGMMLQINICKYEISKMKYYFISFCLLKILWKKSPGRILIQECTQLYYSKELLKKFQAYVSLWAVTKDYFWRCTAVVISFLLSFSLFLPSFTSLSLFISLSFFSFQGFVSTKNIMNE